MKKVYKIIFLGNSGVGKTTLISQYLYSKVHAAAPTIGIDFLNTSYQINGETIRIQVWDTAGQERFHSIVGNYTRNTFLAVIVYSKDDPKSLEKIQFWIDEFVYLHNNKESVKLMIVANKSDIEDTALTEAGKAIAEDVGAKFVNTCALDRGKIEEMIVGINEYIEEDIEKGGNSEEEQNENKLIIGKKTSGCC